jgi:glucose/arabinose dehydrogenase
MKKVLSVSFLILLASHFTLSQIYTLQNAFPNLTFSNPVFLTSAGDSTDRVFVVQQSGIIKVFQNDGSTNIAKTFLDITDRVVSGGEMGLLGLAFHPDYKNNGYFYVNYTTTTPYMRTVIARFQVTSNPDSADKNSELQILTYKQPFSNHNCGWLGFRPSDGYLYIGVGDGGSGGDPNNYAQNIDSLLGKILRIDIDNPDSVRNYGIPPDNPFVDSTGAVRKEIFAWGMRNPWRDSFDPVTDWFWCADVGQGAWEEIDIIENGKNYGWRCYEGTHPYNTSGCDYPEYIDPIWEYPHGAECSITGGYVYRGPDVPQLQGKYIYGDYCSAKIWSLEYDGISPPTNTYLLNAPSSLLSFGVSQNNELFILCSNGKIYKFAPTITSVNNENKINDFSLEQNYPNPFNPETNLNFTLPEKSKVKLSIYNSIGEIVSVLLDENLDAGNHNKNWVAEGLSSGIYFARLTATFLESGNTYSKSIKMIYLK